MFHKHRLQRATLPCISVELLTNSCCDFVFLIDLSAAQRKFAHSLREFKFEFIGDAETDDERCIGM